MSNGNSLDSALLAIAWQLAWDPSRPYFLPRFIEHGISFNGIHVDSLGELVLGQFGPFPLFESVSTGLVSVQMVDTVVRNFQVIENEGFTYDASSGVMTATLSFPQLVLAGTYQVFLGHGGDNCAVDAAYSAIGLFQKPTRTDPNAPDDPNLALAKSYRDQLITSDNGLALVGMYYDNNETMNAVLENDATFQHLWKTYQYPRQDGTLVSTAQLASQTADGAKSPDANLIGGLDYNTHANILREFYLQAVTRAEKSNADPALRKLATDIATFNGYVGSSGLQTSTATSVGAVMNAVATTSRDAMRDTAGAADDPVMAEALVRARQIAAEEWAKAEAEVAYQRRTAAAASATASSSDPVIQGQFEDIFQVPALTITASFTIAGTPPDLTIAVDFTAIQVEIPNIRILLTGPGSPLFVKVAGAVANSGFIQGLVSSKIAERINASDIRDFLSGRLNQALSQAFGA